MDFNMQWIIENKVKRTIEALNINNMNGYFVQDKKECIELIKKLTNEGETIGVGGSMTLFEVGIIDFLRNNNYNFLDRYKEGLSKEEIKKIYRSCFLADSFLTSTNAITENGELYNVDGNGNRVAAMLYGPDKVIVVVGVNKIVKDLDEAIKRNKYISAPANAKRLNLSTPCNKSGYCMDCNSKNRICNEYTVIKRQNVKNRIHVIIVNETLGY